MNWCLLFFCQPGLELRKFVASGVDHTCNPGANLLAFFRLSSSCNENRNHHIILLYNSKVRERMFGSDSSNHSWPFSNGRSASLKSIYRKLLSPFMLTFKLQWKLNQLQTPRLLIMWILLILLHSLRFTWDGFEQEWFYIPPLSWVESHHIFAGRVYNTSYKLKSLPQTKTLCFSHKFDCLKLLRLLMCFIYPFPFCWVKHLHGWGGQSVWHMEAPFSVEKHVQINPGVQHPP